MASSQLPFRDNPNGSVAVHDDAADTGSADNENHHAESLNSNVAAHVHAAGDASSDDKHEPTEEAKYSNPVNGHFPPQPSLGPPFDLMEEQRGKIRWAPGYDAVPDPIMVENIDVAAIKNVVAAHIHLVGLDKDDFEVEYFAEGDFNILYTVRKASQPPGSGTEYIFRVSLPTYPWHKVESEIATMELVRMYTNIPVPRVYVYDSDADNPVGYEWMMMDKVKGIPFREAREAMDMEQKTKLAHTLADWMHQLSTLRFGKIGSVYRRRLKPATSKNDFKVGPIVDMAFMADWRLSYKLHRGPYTSIEQFLRAIIDVNHADVLEGRQKMRSDFCVARKELEWLTCNLDDCDKYDRKTIAEFQEQWASQPPESKQARIDQLRNKVTMYEENVPEAENTIFHGRPRYDLGDPGDELDRTRNLFQRLSTQCRALLYMVPHLCPAEILSESSTVLHHWDVSANNVLIDPASGTAVALIDWEQVQTLPYSLIHPFPSAIDDRYDMTVPPNPPATDADEHFHYTYKVNLAYYENSLLRKAFRQRLEELQSPHLEAFEEREPDLKDLLALARYADQICMKNRIKELVEKLEEEIGRGF
ncbi:Altered inheritance of mitochondria protein 9 [Lasiodiplodia hormozganensis]|uniref:Altered inheritance of mitochondria protein 9 n=1 Tax=Lasiodiplodia hormozganensis TaxID=869390 RepID=A0AA39U0L7_9PEZI|nr:Altered inheritance of mitochondria protein 9 [Lasiodiplodia hormozganensis]